MTDLIEIESSVMHKIVKEDYWHDGKLIKVRYFIKTKDSAYKEFDFWKWVKQELPDGTSRRQAFSTVSEAEQYISLNLY
jgi:hypothetical protein